MGPGISQVFNGAANTTYFWLLLEVFKVKDKWSLRQKAMLILYAIGAMSASALIMTSYTHGFPSIVLIPMVFYLLLVIINYVLWIVECNKILRRITEDKYISRFKDLRGTAIAFLLVLIFTSLSGLSETISYASWIGMTFILIGLYFAYRSYIYTE